MPSTASARVSASSASLGQRIFVSTQARRAWAWARWARVAGASKTGMVAASSTSACNPSSRQDALLRARLAPVHVDLQDPEHRAGVVDGEEWLELLGDLVRVERAQPGAQLIGLGRAVVGPQRARLRLPQQRRGDGGVGLLEQRQRGGRVRVQQEVGAQDRDRRVLRLGRQRHRQHVLGLLQQLGGARSVHRGAARCLQRLPMNEERAAQPPAERDVVGVGLMQAAQQ